MRVKTLISMILVVVLLGAGLVTYPMPVKANGATPPSITLTVVSDVTNEWWDGTTWQPAVACWVHPAWPSIPGATWIWRTKYTDPSWEYENVPEGGWEFRKIFILPTNAYDIIGSINITADNVYGLWVNEVYIGGDYRCAAIGWATIETFDITAALQPGENLIRIQALNYGSWGDAYTNPAGLIYRADISYKLPIAAIINIDPDTLNLKSKGKWITCYIELPEGYDVAEIDGSTVMLEGTIPAYMGKEGWAKPEANESNIVDSDGDGILERMVKFDRAAVIDLLKPVPHSDVTLTVTGKVAGIPFEGSDTIKVIGKQESGQIDASKQFSKSCFTPGASKSGPL